MSAINNYTQKDTGYLRRHRNPQSEQPICQGKTNPVIWLARPTSERDFNGKRLAVPPLFQGRQAVCRISGMLDSRAAPW